MSVASFFGQKINVINICWFWNSGQMKTSQNHILFVPFCRLLAFSLTKDGTISLARTSALLSQRLLAGPQPLLAGPGRTSHKCWIFSSCPRVWNNFPTRSTLVKSISQSKIISTIPNPFHHPKSIPPADFAKIVLLFRLPTFRSVKWCPKN